MLMPYADIGISAGLPRGTIRVVAFILRSSGEVTNQWLPGVGGSMSNLGHTPDMTTIPNAQFVAVPLDIPGDFDGDGYVDQTDLDHLLACSSGPTTPQTDPTCDDAKFDADDDVDQVDFGIFQPCYGGENNPGDPNCAD